MTLRELFDAVVANNATLSLCDGEAQHAEMELRAWAADHFATVRREDHGMVRNGRKLETVFVCFGTAVIMVNRPAQPTSEVA